MEELDPFLFQGSTVLAGCGEMLVCRIEAQTKQEPGEIEIELGLGGVAVLQQVVRAMKLSVLLPVLIFGIRWLLEVERGEYAAFVRLVSVLGTLWLYAAYLNEQASLQALGKHMLDQQHGPHWSISHLLALEQLACADILLVDDKYRGNLDELSLLNQFHNVKIVTERGLTDVVKEFA
jgi:hypothetical protein